MWPIPMHTLTNSELTAHIRRKDQQLKALAEMSAGMTALQDLATLMAFTASHTRDLLEVEAVTILGWDERAEELILIGAAHTDYTRQFCSANDPGVPPDAGVQTESSSYPSHYRAFTLARECWESRRPVLFPSARDEVLSRESDFLLFVPFEDTRQASGVIFVKRPFSQRHFDEDEISLLTLVASQAAASYRNLQLLSDMRSQIKNIHAVQEVGNLLVSTFDVSAVLQLIVRGIRDVTGAGVCSIMLWDETGEFLVIRASEGVPDWVVRQARVKRGHNISGWVAQEGKPLLIKNIDEDSRFEGTAEGRYRSKSLLSVPLKTRGQVLGVINVNNDLFPRVFTEQDQELLMLFANQAAIALENARLYGELEKLAITDGLTGLANHRTFQERLLREISRAERFGQELSLIILDIDHFKLVNDKYGHQVGDQVLRSVGNALQDQLRKMDFVARYGGEEFAVIMPQTRKNEAVHIAERLRESIAQGRYLKAEPNRSITISLGVAEYPTDATEPSTLVEKADRALYVSKEQGRDRVTAAGKGYD